MAMLAPALPFISAAISTVGVGMSVFSGFQGASQQRAQANYQRKVAKNNQIAAEYAAQDAIARGEVTERRSRLKTAALIGTQRAALAGNGVLVDSGSALDITTDTAGIGEWDALTIRDNAQREARNIRNQGAGYGSQADMYGMAKDNASGWNGIGDSLTGVGTVAAKWYDLAFGGTKPDAMTTGAGYTSAQFS